MAPAGHPAYGLAAGLQTRDLSRVIRLTWPLQAGTVWVNRLGRSRGHILATGGYKPSGIGKDLGARGQSRRPPQQKRADRAAIR